MISKYIYLKTFSFIYGLGFLIPPPPMSVSPSLLVIVEILGKSNAITKPINFIQLIVVKPKPIDCSNSKCVSAKADTAIKTPIAFNNVSFF